MTGPVGGGVVAAGHTDSAAAGAAVLAAGGNAVDAAVATGFAAVVAEPLQTSLGGGGFMLVDMPGATPVLLDFFVAAPGIGAAARTAAMLPTAMDFGGAVQEFHGGHGSVAVPGTAVGLFHAHDRFGRLPIAEVIAPARDLARRGVVQTPQQEVLNRLLSPVLRLTPESAAAYEPGGEPLRAGEVRIVPHLAETLDHLAVHGAEAFTTGEIANRLAAEIARGGGLLGATDLAAYRVVERVPVRAPYRDCEVLTNPPPSSGGALIALALRLLDGVDLRGLGWHSLGHARTLLAVLGVVDAARQARFDTHVRDDDVLDRLLAAAAVDEDRVRLLAQLGNTTHVSVVDAEGGAVSMTSSNGACAGVVIPGTGVQCNNMLGEADLNPGGAFSAAAGSRITSMMAPSIVVREGAPLVVLGSAGSTRIRSAILQVLSNVVDFGMAVDAAIDAPRMHVEAGRCDLEGGMPAAVAEGLRAGGLTVVPFAERNLYFGGVQAVAAEAGGWRGHGDPRRGGLAVAVPG